MGKFSIQKIKLHLSVVAALVMLSALVALYLMNHAASNGSSLHEIYSWLVALNSIGSAALLILVLANVVWLVRQLRRNAAGSVLTARMLFVFAVLALAPAGVVFYFSMQFLHRGIDSWFDVEVDGAMDAALELGRAALDQRMVGYLSRTEQIAEQLATVPEGPELGVELSELRDNSGASEMTVFGRDGKILATVGGRAEQLIPSVPDEGVMRQVRHGDSYVGLDQIAEEGVAIRAVVEIAVRQPVYLQALYPVPYRISRLANKVQDAYAHYKQMLYLRDSLKFSYILMLSLVLLLTLLAATWAAFVSVRRLIAPVRELAGATRAISQGDYSRRLPVHGNDELSFLVTSFNTMTERIAHARDEVQTAQHEAESQRAYVETILDNLSSGVIAFDARLRVQTANHAAGRILHADLAAVGGKRLLELHRSAPHLLDWVELVHSRLELAHGLWREEATITGPSGRQDLLCRGTPLTNADGERTGAVIVFDDVTALLQAQRAAAWGEVARRLAHEIKNPLTPIQLSAERLKLKLGDHLTEKDCEVLEKATRTIVQQVEAMKKMVNAFAEYARQPKLQRENVDLRTLVEEVMGLYPPQSGITFELSVAAGLPVVDGDPVLLRQVLHNLFKNAQEAFETASGGRIAVALRALRDDDREMVELAVRDDGPGVPQDQADRIFDPYVTHKARGTGLGLAIVRKIVEEHGGKIWLDRSYREGAAFILRLPSGSDSDLPEAPLRSEPRRLAT